MAEREETTDAYYLNEEIFRGSVNYTKSIASASAGSR